MPTPVFTAEDLFFGMINEANPSLGRGPLSADNVALSNPFVLIDDPSGKNTKVNVSGIAGEGYTGLVSFTYNRLDIQSQVADRLAPIGVIIQDSEFAIIADVVNEVNTTLDLATYSLRLTAADVSNAADPIPATAYPKQITLNIVNNHLSYVGQLAVTIVDGTMPDMVTEVALDGFNLPQLQ